MSTSTARSFTPKAVSACVVDDMLQIVLADGRRLSVPLAYFPRLVNATSEQRSAVEIHGGGRDLRWEEIDEDISVPGLLGLPD